LFSSQESAPETESPVDDKVVPTPEVDKTTKKVADPLQREVDPKLLVSSKYKGTAARLCVVKRHPEKAKVHVLNSIFVDVLEDIQSVQKPSVT
jgi:hypothetical protein